MNTMMRPHQLPAVLRAYKNLQKVTQYYLSTIALVTFLVAVPQRGYAVDWVPINGQIQFEGTPLCALVLANGQHMFSCDGTGTYNLSVPLDANGTITLYAFASGFSPFKQVLTAGEAAIYHVGMVRSDTSRELEVLQTINPGTRDNWVNISGTVKYDGSPLCTMVLANGQHMFTCGNNLGRFSMNVPLDANRKITLYSFAAGFAPSKNSLSGGSNTGGGCTDGALGCLTISGDSQVPGTFVPTDKTVGLVNNENFTVIFDEINNEVYFDSWELDARIFNPPFGSGGARIYFGKPFRGVEYICEAGIIGSYGNCNGANYDLNARTITFSNVQLQGPNFGAVITLNGTLKY